MLLSRPFFGEVLHVNILRSDEFGKEARDPSVGGLCEGPEVRDQHGKDEGRGEDKRRR